MRKFTAAIDIEACPQRVVAGLVDVERWPEWTPTMTEVRLLDGGPLAIGKRALVRQPKLPPGIYTVTDLDARGFTWVTGGRGMRLEAGHFVTATPSGTHLELTLTFSGVLAPLVAYLYRKLSQGYLNTESVSLRQLLQGSSNSREPL